MLFRETELPGAWIIEPERRADARGFFARTWCRDEFSAHDLTPDFVQQNLSVNPAEGTLRGLHFQTAPHGEVKLVRCTRGAVYDVIVDVRPSSPSYRRWIGVELRAEEYRMLYVPVGFAHGFQTLVDDSEVTYLVSHPYVPEAGRGIRYDDPAIAVSWPCAVTRISDQDKDWPLLDASPAAPQTVGVG